MQKHGTASYIKHLDNKGTININKKHGTASYIKHLDNKGTININKKHGTASYIRQPGRTPSINITKIMTAVATPFYRGEVDEMSFIKLLHLQMQQKVSALVINGTTGESPCLTQAEVERLVTIAKTECKGALPLILGVGGNSTQTVLHNIELAEKWGADAVLAVTPYYNKPPQRGLVQHFSVLAEATTLPVILYNVPSRTGVTIGLDALKQLSRYSNVVAIKEASGDLEFGQQIIQQNRLDGKPWQVLSGDDMSCMQLIALGGAGGICVLSHIVGDKMQQLQQKILDGDKTAVKTYQQSYSKLLKVIYMESNPIGIKMALKLMGVFRSAEVRSPLVALEKEHTKRLKRLLRTMDLI